MTLKNSMMIDISIHDVPGEERDRETVRREVDRRISQSTRPMKGATTFRIMHRAGYGYSIPWVFL